MPTVTQRSGLTAAEVAKRVAHGQINRVRRSARAEYLAIVGRNLFTLFNALVLPAAVALFVLGAFSDAFAVSGMALTNLVLGLVQEIRAKHYLDQISLLSETRVRVLRDGKIESIPSGDVVQDDVLLLGAGETVVADGPVLEAQYLEVDEALLTGESDPVSRRPGDGLLSGSLCVTGTGSYRAEKIGEQAFAQRTSREARKYRYAASPIQNSINRLLALLTATAVALCVGYVVLYFVRDVARVDLWKMIAATITSMVPQGLVVMATFAFVLGAVRMSRRGALVHRLQAVEAMASIDVLCMDKTGTLTTNRLHLTRLLILDKTFSEEAIRDCLRLFASVTLGRFSKTVAALRDALGEIAGEALDQLPFKSQNRYSAVRVRDAATERVLVLGAMESLRPLLQAPHESVQTEKDLLGEGLRLLLFAEAVNPPHRPFAGSLEGFALRPLALVALRDELRPEARRVLEVLAAQGFVFKVLSGDDAATVHATVAALTAGTTQPALVELVQTPVVSGAELHASNHPSELVRSRYVFGRVSPAQKVQIISLLKEQDKHVAMIGDGVNDVLPIKNAHLGIAMGDGAAASKSVSSIVLEANNFDLLPETLDEGRTILRNLRRAGKLFLVKNVYTLVLVVGSLALLGLPFPYLPPQVTLLNFLTIGAPVFFIMLDRQRSSSVAAAGFLREIGSFALRTGLTIGLAGLLLVWIAKHVWRDTEKTQRTLLLTFLVLIGLTTLLRALEDNRAPVRAGNRLYLGLIAAALLVYVAVMYAPWVGDFFVLTPLTWKQWRWVLTFVAVVGVGLCASDRGYRSRFRATSEATRPGD